MFFIHRRAFVQGSISLGLGLAAGGSGRAVAANDKIRVACIGVRGRGNSVMNTFASDELCEVSHIVDVNQTVREQRAEEIKKKTGKKPAVVNDYRTLLDDKSVDAFMVATPDHWHALLTIDGCLHGKDVYVEKPASHNIAEGKAAVAAARKTNRIVQVGTQIRSAPFLKEAADYVKSGAIGKVMFGRAWETDRNSRIKFAPNGTPPKTFDYDIWQGPCAERPYNPTIVGGAWRWLFDYGTGDLGNDGVHRIDYCRYVMGLHDFPSAITATGGKFHFGDDDQEWPDTLIVNYEYPNAVLEYEMRLWSRPRLEGATEGASIYGENGRLLITNSTWKAFDAADKLVKQGGTDGKTTERLHVRNFLDAMRTRNRESLTQEIWSGHVSSAMCHAGNIAWRVRKRLSLDPKTQTFHDPDADKLVARAVQRKGFEIPTIA